MRLGSMLSKLTGRGSVPVQRAFPSYTELRNTPSRMLPADLQAAEASDDFSRRQDALQQALLAPEKRPADDAVLFTSLVVAEPRGVVTFPLPDGGRCVPVFTSPLRAADYLSLIVGPEERIGFIASAPTGLLNMLRDLDAAGVDTIALDRCPRCTTFSFARTTSLRAASDSVVLWAVTTATRMARLELYRAHALMLARGGRYQDAKAIALETVGHVDIGDPHAHFLLGELGLALRDRQLTNEARVFLQLLNAEPWLHALSNAVASEEPTFSDEM